MTIRGREAPCSILWHAAWHSGILWHVAQQTNPWEKARLCVPIKRSSMRRQHCALCVVACGLGLGLLGLLALLRDDRTMDRTAASARTEVVTAAWPIAVAGIDGAAAAGGGRLHGAAERADNLIVYVRIPGGGVSQCRYCVALAAPWVTVHPPLEESQYTFQTIIAMERGRQRIQIVGVAPLPGGSGELLANATYHWTPSEWMDGGCGQPEAHCDRLWDGGLNDEDVGPPVRRASPPFCVVLPLPSEPSSSFNCLSSTQVPWPTGPAWYNTAFPCAFTASQCLSLHCGSYRFEPHCLSGPKQAGWPSGLGRAVVRSRTRGKGSSGSGKPCTRVRATRGQQMLARLSLEPGTWPSALDIHPAT